jgi:3-hydroxy-9,10-secoandrosta-1,3,5(10)-triene-9,17-dione monooxygenase reductase component
MAAIPAVRSVEPVLFRSVLGHFPSGVTVVTGHDGARTLGFTCQSFSALSLDPPLVVVLVSRASTSWPVIAETAGFCVNVLSRHQKSLSAQFARSGTDKYAGVAWHATGSGRPVLDDATAWVDCALDATHDGGDHLIVVGRVLDLGAADDTPSPLVFFRGGYTHTDHGESAR